MSTKRWLVQMEDGVHEVSAEHKYWSGQCRIVVDGQIVDDSHHFLDTGGNHQFRLLGHVCTLTVDVGAFGVDMSLLVDGMEPSQFSRTRLAAAPARAPGARERVIERQVVVARCRYCSELTPVDLPACRHCGAPNYS